MVHADEFDADAIRAGLAAAGENVDVEVLASCSSTNSELLSRVPGSRPVLLLAEVQTAGRGRRGRRWHAEPGSAILLSLRWEFAPDATRLAGLSLAVGVSMASTLRKLGATAVRLKWPNDLLSSADGASAKLGGILIETRSSPRGLAAVIGVGLNFRPTTGLSAQLRRSVSSLEELVAPLPSRTIVTTRLAAGLLTTLREFSDAGFQPFRAGWEALHANQGETVKIRTANGKVVSGIADGVANDGGLLLRTRRGIECIHSGTMVRETGLRRQPA